MNVKQWLLTTNKIIILLVLIIIGVSCSEKQMQNQNQRLLLDKIWLTTYYYDYSINETFYTDSTKYIFGSNQHLAIIKQNDTTQTNWQFIDYNHIEISGQAYKIASLSRKIMVLRYGKMDVVFLPEERKW